MLWILIIVVGFGLDRLSKNWVLQSLVENPVTVIKNFFYFRYLENKGAAFSLLHGKTVLLAILTSIVLLVLIIVLIKNKGTFLRTSLAIIIGGASGNLYDRLFRGSVVDFIEFHIGPYAFPTFNIADTFVVVGTILLAIYILFVYKEDTVKAEKTGQENDVE